MFKACLTVVLIAIAGSGAAPESRPATHSLAEIRAQLEETQSLITGVYATYEFVDPMNRANPGGYVRREVAARATGEFYHSGAHATQSCPWQEDPFAQRLTVSGNSAVVEHPFSRAFTIYPLAPDAQLPGTASNDPFLAAMGWWPFLHRPSPQTSADTPLSLRDISRSPNYALLPNQELVEGRWCHVIEMAGRDRIWLDTQCNCTPIARAVFDSENGCLLRRVSLKDLHEIKPHIWVPNQVRDLRYGAGDVNGAIIPVLQADRTMKLVSLQLNEQVTDALFRPAPAEGSIEVFPDGRFEQKTAGGGAYLDHLVRWVQQYMSLKSSPAQPWGWVEATIENASIIVGAGVLLAWRFPKRTKNRRNFSSQIRETMAAEEPSKESSRPQISIIVPTLNEAENMPLLIPRIVKALSGYPLEIVVVDDRSSDGTADVCEQLRSICANLIVLERPVATGGLSGAVVDGFDRAGGQVLVAMDADLQHPPEELVTLIRDVADRTMDMTIGSRHVAGSHIADDWGSARRILSLIACLAAKPLTRRVRDPMSGFFAINRSTYRSIRYRINPLGYKIGLELLCRIDLQRVREVPIAFATRQHGRSKLTLQQELQFLKHLYLLYRAKWKLRSAPSAGSVASSPRLAQHP